MSTSRWADGPWDLMETPSATKDISDHPAHYIANEMAFAHNAMLRGLNAIYLQAPNIPPNTPEAKDFLFLITSWASWILHHHDLEEIHIFPLFEAVPGVKKGTLNENVTQHEAFASGLRILDEYARTTSPEDFDGMKVNDLIDTFANALQRHLTDEIPTLWALDSVPQSHCQELLTIWKQCEAEAGKQDKFVVAPMVFGLCDKTFEGGNDWPKMPWFAEYAVDYILWWRNAGAWRFLPSDGWRMPKELPFVKVVD